MEITRTDVLTFALVLSILLNVYEAVELATISRSETEYIVGEQPLGGTEIDTDRAKELVDAYKKAHPDPEVRGFVFSRRAFEDILYNDENNYPAIAMYLIGDDSKSLRLIMRGVRSDKTVITTDYDNHIFVVQTLCPYDCAGW